MMLMMRSHHMLTDVILEVGGELFHAHKVVLASASPYFKVCNIHKCARNFITVIYISCLYICNCSMRMAQYNQEETYSYIQGVKVLQNSDVCTIHLNEQMSKKVPFNVCPNISACWDMDDVDVISTVDAACGSHACQHNFHPFISQQWLLFQEILVSLKLPDKHSLPHLPFLNLDIYRKTDGSLGHNVYRKPTHTNLYIHQSSHHHPANKQSVLTSLIHRAKALCDKDSLKQELEFLTTVFKDNGYSPNRYDEPWNRQHGPPRPMINPPQLHTFRTPKQHMADSAECWPNTTWKVSPYHLEKHRATVHQSRTHWD